MDEESSVSLPTSFLVYQTVYELAVKVNGIEYPRKTTEYLPLIKNVDNDSCVCGPNDAININKKECKAISNLGQPNLTLVVDNSADPLCPKLTITMNLHQIEIDFSATHTGLD